MRTIEPVLGGGPVLAATDTRAVRPTPSQRSRGDLRLSFKRRGGATVLDGLFQSGCLKARLLVPESGHFPEAVLLNTAGGLTGGDHLSLAIDWGKGAHAAVTTQACERIYRAADSTALVRTSLNIGPGAHGEWLPQETIVFDHSGLDRELNIRLAEDARFTGVEALILGREAMGEVVRRAELRDSWRIWRAGRLIYADVMRLEGELGAMLARAATLGGRIALASILHAAPNVEGLLANVCSALAACDCSCAASTFNGLLMIRFVAENGVKLRRAVSGALHALRSGHPPPRVWQT